MDKAKANSILRSVLKNGVNIIKIVDYGLSYISAVVYDGKSDFPNYVVVSLNRYAYPYSCTVYNCMFGRRLKYDDIDVLKDEYKQEIKDYYN